MEPLTRKQRELLERETQILRVARPILVREGFQSLSMERIAQQLEYAKGTIYNHFPNKEEIVLALAIESMEVRRRLFETAVLTPGSARKRMMTVGTACEYFTRECKEHFEIEQWMRNENIWDKSSEKRQTLIRQCEAQCMSLVAGVVRDGVAQGDLLIPREMTFEDFVFGFWALSYGSQILTYSSPSLPALGIFDSIRAMRIHCCTLLNGFHWQPLESIENYMNLVEEITESMRSRFSSAMKN